MKISLVQKNLTQRFLEVPDQFGMTISSVIHGNPVLWTFLIENFNLGIAEISVISKNSFFPNPVLPRNSVITFSVDNDYCTDTTNMNFYGIPVKGRNFEIIS